MTNISCESPDNGMLDASRTLTNVPYMITTPLVQYHSSNNKYVTILRSTINTQINTKQVLTMKVICLVVCLVASAVVAKVIDKRKCPEVRAVPHFDLPQVSDIN